MGRRMNRKKGGGGIKLKGVNTFPGFFFYSSRLFRYEKALRSLRLMPSSILAVWLFFPFERAESAQGNSREDWSRFRFCLRGWWVG